MCSLGRLHVPLPRYCFLFASNSCFNKSFQRSSWNLHTSLGRWRKHEENSAMNGSNQKTKLKTVSRLLLLAKPETVRISLAIGFLTISSGVTLSVPYFIGSIIDKIYTLDNKTELMTHLQSTANFLLMLFVVGALANGMRIYFIQSSGQRIIQRLRRDVFRALVQADVAFFDQSQTGELLNRLSNDTQVVGSSLTYNLSDGLRSSLQVIGGVSLMAYTSPQLTMAVMGILPPVVIIAMMIGRFLKRISAQVQDSLALSSQFAEERLSNMRLVKAFAKERVELRSYAQKVEDVFQIANKQVIGQSLFYMMNGFTGNLMILGVFYYGGIMVHSSSLSVGGLSSFILYSTYVGISIGGLSNFYAEIMKAIGASGRIWELIDNKPSIPTECDHYQTSVAEIKPQSIEGRIEFENISFTYPSRPELSVLENFSLSVHPGKVTALVGKSGCGKSTVASLLMRLYDPNQGTIFVDSIPLHQYSIKDFRSHIAFVSQDPVMFSCSIRENIEYGSLDSDSVSFEKVKAAAEVANCLEFIQSFPQQFETLVGQRGVMLSGGQRQRLAIARAILRDPSILILDEATSALDSESEQLVQDALSKILPGRTVIQIAHRLATIRNAHSIAVIENGAVVEQGSYEELMSMKGGYLNELVNLQLLPN